MDYSARILGASVSTTLQERIRAPLLVIGADVLTRHDLAHLDCFNFHAAANLSRILSAELQVKNTRDVFEHVAPEALALPRLGVIALAVLGAAFEAKGLGGDHPLEAWVTKHRAKDAARDYVTFASLKQHARAREHVRIQARRTQALRRVAQFSPRRRTRSA